MTIQSAYQIVKMVHMTLQTQEYESNQDNTLKLNREQQFQLMSHINDLDMIVRATNFAREEHTGLQFGGEYTLEALSRSAMQFRGFRI